MCAQAAKTLLDLQQEHEGLRRKHTMQGHQLEQQKGEMDARRAATAKEHSERLKVGSAGSRPAGQPAAGLLPQPALSMNEAQ